MNEKKRSTLLGAALVVLGILAGIWLADGFSQAGERGPILRWPQGGFQKPEQTTVTEPSVPAGPAAPMGSLFSAEDVTRISLRYGDDCGYRPNLEELLLQPLQWEDVADGPLVLIVHTHGSESYTKLPEQNYIQTTDYRTLNNAYNVVALGDRLAFLLEQAGIRVIHDRTLHDYPSYNASYTNSRASVQAYLRQYPTIRLVVDLHRDAVLNGDGSQYAPVAEVNGTKVAKMMLVVGTDASGMHHPDWQDNLSAALKLQALLERHTAGITRPTILRAQRFNHDLSPGAMIVEMGTAGNTLSEAMAAVPILATAMVELCRGATADSTS